MTLARKIQAKPKKKEKKEDKNGAMCETWKSQERSNKTEKQYLEPYRILTDSF
jgi:hypothetical protein